MVFFRERREADFHTRQIDVAPRAHGALGKNLTTDTVFVFFQHLHVDDSVVHQHRVADMDVIDEAVVVHINRIILLAARAPDGKFKNIPRLQTQFRWQVSRADRGPLCVQQNSAV